LFFCQALLSDRLSIYFPKTPIDGGLKARVAEKTRRLLKKFCGGEYFGANFGQRAAQEHEPKPHGGVTAYSAFRVGTWSPSRSASVSPHGRRILSLVLKNLRHDSGQLNSCNMQNGVEG